MAINWEMLTGIQRASAAPALSGILQSMRRKRQEEMAQRQQAAQEEQQARLADYRDRTADLQESQFEFNRSKYADEVAREEAARVRNEQANQMEAIGDVRKAAIDPERARALAASRGITLRPNVDKDARLDPSFTTQAPTLGQLGKGRYTAELTGGKTVDFEAPSGAEIEEIRRLGMTGGRRAAQTAEAVTSSIRAGEMDPKEGLAAVQRALASEDANRRAAASRSGGGGGISPSQVNTTWNTARTAYESLARDIKDPAEAIEMANKFNAVLTADSALADRYIAGNFVRAAQGAGVLTDQDVNFFFREAGSLFPGETDEGRIVSKFRNIITGRESPEKLGAARDIMDRLAGAAMGRVNEFQEGIERTFGPNARQNWVVPEVADTYYGRGKARTEGLKGRAAGQVDSVDRAASSVDSAVNRLKEAGIEVE